MARLPFDPERTRAARQAARPGSAPPDAAAPGRGESASQQRDDQPRPLTVSQLADRIKTALADHFPQRVRVVGEVSNLRQGQHWFFSLKDEKQATIRCVCFASSARRIATPVEDGMEVVATGRLDYYPAQGQTQLYVDNLEPLGQGALELKLRQLIDQLRKEGYFDEAHKQPLPAMPTRVAVVTSRSAAALQDVINTTQRRWPGCRLMLYDVRVQGASAAPEVAAALRNLSKQGPRLGIDAIILTRGGGSIEDLWAFNEREVADALYECRLPVVAAIGHETDTTVAELVADLRCATPTQAAMKLIPERDALAQQLAHFAGRLRQDLRRQLHHARHRLNSAAGRPFFRRPRELPDRARRQIDQLEKQLARTLPQ
ncbi:MAG: exodeoxyribonuclease VII large subunit, partial [Phycisphaeraceae bacterium]